jgi:hypothetical protein
MSIVTTVTGVLEKLGFIRPLRPWTGAIWPKAKLGNPQISASFGRGGDWASPRASTEFRRAQFVRRSADEMQGRIPIAR